MKKLLLATVITFTPFILPAHASNLTGEALALACAGNVPGTKKGKDTEKYLGFCNAYINGWDDARFAFLQGMKTYGDYPLDDVKGIIPKHIARLPLQSKT